MSLSEKLKGLKTPKKRSEPLWKGPEVDGITQSLLGRFFVCRERFRLYVIEGLAPEDIFSSRLEFGNMWHVCEEELAKPSLGSPNPRGEISPSLFLTLSDYAKTLCKRYPFQQKDVEKWYNVCKLQFPIYVKYWQKHNDVINRTPLLQEQTFCVPYTLPSGRVVKLRGKWDSVDLIKEGKFSGIYLQENKTKSEIDEVQLTRQLKFDLQTMMYLVALEVDKSNDMGHLATLEQTEPPAFSRDAKILGVRYNVIRRPLSGGKGTIRQHQPTKSNPQGESLSDYYARLKGIIEESPQDYFARWKVEVSPKDIEVFRHRCLDPILEQLCDWYDWVGDMKDTPDVFSIAEDYETGIHWQHPFGVYNILNEGGNSDLDECVLNGSQVGLRQVETLFGELE